MLSVQERIPLVIQGDSLNADRVQQAFKDIWTELAKLKGIPTLSYGGAFNKDFAAKPGCVYLVDPSAAQVNVTLPNPANCDLERILIINGTSSANVIQLRASNASTIVGAATYNMSTAWQTLELTALSPSTQWSIR